MNAPVRAPRIEHDRFAALLAATPAPVATGGVVRVAHYLVSCNRLVIDLTPDFAADWRAVPVEVRPIVPVTELCAKGRSR